MWTLVVALVAGVVTAANAAYTEVATEMPWTAGVTVSQLALATSGSGLQTYDVQGADVTFAPGDTADILYKLYLLEEGGDLRHVYSQSNAAEVFKLRVGAGTVIQGFDEAVQSMGVGSKRVAVLPPQIAYGARGMPSFGIPG